MARKQSAQKKKKTEFLSRFPRYFSKKFGEFDLFGPIFPKKKKKKKKNGPIFPEKGEKTEGKPEWELEGEPEEKLEGKPEGKPEGASIFQVFKEFSNNLRKFGQTQVSWVTRISKIPSFLAKSGRCRTFSKNFQKYPG